MRTFLASSVFSNNVLNIIDISNERTHIATVVYHRGTCVHVVYIIKLPTCLYTKACCFKCDREAPVNRLDLVIRYDACMPLVSLFTY